MSNKQLTADIVIAGGGVTGLAFAALILKFSKLRVVIVEAREQMSAANIEDQGFDARSVALSAYSCEILTSMDIDINQIGCPIQQIHVSDKGHLGQCTLNADDYVIEKLGSVVELTRLQATLAERLSAQAAKCDSNDEPSQLEWLFADQIVSVNQQINNIDIELSSGNKVAAKLLVVAEGANSETSKLLGIESTFHPYEQSAIVANIELKEAHNFEAFERFTDTGPLAMLPMPATGSVQQNKQCSLVWTVKPAQAEQLLALKQQEFLDDLQKVFGHRLGKFVGVSKRASFPLALIQAQRCHAHRAVLLGNASQMLHPIAGQGLNLALRDVVNLVNIVTSQQLTKISGVRAVEINGSDPADFLVDVGRYSLLREYAASRQRDHKMMVTSTDALVRTFSNNYLPLIIGRNVGLCLLDHLSMFKTQLATTAMGFKSRVVFNNKEMP